MSSKGLDETIVVVDMEEKGQSLERLGKQKQKNMVKNKIRGMVKGGGI